MTDDITHGGLIESLVNWRQGPRRLVFRECKLGSEWINGGVPIADVLTLQTRYRDPMPTIYEVKVSRGDFLSDIRGEKWRKYLPLSSRLYFAVPLGVVGKDDVPAECGLITYSPERRTWRTAKAAPVREVRYTDEVWLSLLFRQREEAVRVRDLAERVADIQNVGLNAIAKDLGEDVRQKLLALDADLERARADRAWAEQHLASARRKCDAHRRWEQGLEALLAANEGVELYRDGRDIGITIVAADHSHKDGGWARTVKGALDKLAAAGQAVVSGTVAEGGTGDGKA